FVEQDLVYRAKRPVLWSYGAGTALAEAEVEYKDKVSPAIYVKFDLVDGPDFAKGAALVIWTTTPWTLPANLAIALHPDFDYLVGDFTNTEGKTLKLVIAKSLLEDFQKQTSLTLSGISSEFKGKDLAGSNAQHPFLPRHSLVINADFVTAETGTGLVHVAPGHGADDYQAGMAHGLEILSPVDDKGQYTAEAGLPELVGTHVFKANEPVIALLQEKG